MSSSQINDSEKHETGAGGNDEEERESEHGFSTNMLSNEWMTYFLKQLEGNFESSSVTLLGFNWSKELHQFISSYEKQATARGSIT